MAQHFASSSTFQLLIEIVLLVAKLQVRELIPIESFLGTYDMLPFLPRMI
jgi:hypothetical protein